MKILFLTSHPLEGAAPRYRVYQYIPYLKEKGMQFKIRPFVSSRFYKILYTQGNYLKKSIHFLLSTINRAVDLFLSLQYDLVFIQREAFPIGPPIIEFILSKILLKPIIYDFDDALFLDRRDKSSFNIFKTSKIKHIIALSDYVLAGNNYLQEYALRFSKNVDTLPTSIETAKFFPNRPMQDKIIIGWIGSHSTTPYLLDLKNVFKELAKKYAFELRIIGADQKLSIPGVNIINKKWALETEAQDFQELTIGVYPLPEDQWTLGKCGFKAIQYMSVGIPTVASPVGINKEIIDDGKNGFFAKTEQEWIAKISRLIEDKRLREKLGQNGRRTIAEQYSTSFNFAKLFTVINEFNKVNMLQLISDLDIGGTEKMLVELVAGLDKSKYQLHVCSIKPPGLIAADIARIKHVDLLSLNTESKFNFFVFFKLFYLLKKHKINLLQSYLFFDNLLGSIIGKLAGIPIIIGGHRAVERKKIMWKTVFQRLANRFMDIIIANSYAGQTDLIKNMQVPCSKTAVIHNGKTISYYDQTQADYSVLAKSGINCKEAVIVGMVGRMHEQKGHEYLLKAAASIKDERIKFVLVGDGPLMAKMKNLANQLQIEGKILFLGEIRDIRPIVSFFDIFVLPSLWEGLPGVILEAMIMQKPVVATAIDGNTELVADRRTGFLVPPKDPHALAEKIMELADNKQLRIRMGREGRKRAERYFTVDRMVQEYETVYDRLIEKKIRCQNPKSFT